MLITAARQFILSVQGSAGTSQVSHWDDFREMLNMHLWQTISTEMLIWVKILAFR